MNHGLFNSLTFSPSLFSLTRIPFTEAFTVRLCCVPLPGAFTVNLYSVLWVVTFLFFLKKNSHNSCMSTYCIRYLMHQLPFVSLNFLSMSPTSIAGLVSLLRSRISWHFFFKKNLPYPLIQLTFSSHLFSQPLHLPRCPFRDDLPFWIMPSLIQLPFSLHFFPLAPPLTAMRFRLNHALFDSITLFP